MIKFKRLIEAAITPTRSTPLAAGFDLYSTYGYTLKPGQRHTFKTGIAWAAPAGFVGLVKPRSGLAHKHGLDTMAGVIDADYRGDIGVILINHGDQPYTVHPGDRIAQFVVCEHMWEAVEVDNLDDTERGDSGYGSSGK